jgi:hypothetical protein
MRVREDCTQVLLLLLLLPLLLLKGKVLVSKAV